MDNADKRVKFLAKLPPELRRWLKIAAAERGVDMNALLVAALDSARMRLDGTAARAYQAVFAAITDGKNREAALVLRDLSPENLTELHVICGDVQIMVEADQRRREELEAGQ